FGSRGLGFAAGVRTGGGAIGATRSAIEVVTGIGRVAGLRRMLSARISRSTPASPTKIHFGKPSGDAGSTVARRTGGSITGGSGAGAGTAMIGGSGSGGARAAD